MASTAVDYRVEEIQRGWRSRVSIDAPGKPSLYQKVALPGWDTVAVVTVGPATGALVRSRATGLYCMANAGALRSLTQGKVLDALQKNHAEQKS